MSDRRTFLGSLVAPAMLPVSNAAAATTAMSSRDYLKELGVRPFINAAGTYTAFTASLMPPEVMQAMQTMSRKYVHLVELNEAVGRRIASLVHAEAAMVTAGAASALTLGTAACMTGTDTDRIRRLPDSTGLKNEVIIQKSHRYGYDHAVRNCGTKMIEVETAEQLEAAINPNTVMMLFFNANESLGQIKSQQFVELGKKHHIPTFTDAAADVPPVENLWKFTKMGFDLVTFSGGKGMRGPQSTGLLLGRKDLIQAAMLNAPPNSDSVGRGQKVNKEEMVGLMVAIEMYVKRDHAAEWKEWERRAAIVRESLGSMHGVKTDIWMGEVANHVPHVKVTWEPGAVKLSVPEIQKKMREGDPAIELTPGEDLVVGMWTLEPGEAEIVAKRLKEVMKSGAA